MGDTTKARAARRRYADERMAQELIGRGWFCAHTDVRFDPRPGLQVYATNELRETYRVVGWTEDDRPILAGGGKANNVFEGLQTYLYTIGPK